MAKPASCATATAASPEKAYRPWIPATGSSDGTPSYPRPTTAIRRECQAKAGRRRQPRHPAPERRRTARSSRRRKLFCTRLRRAQRSPATARVPQEARSQRSGQKPEPDPKQPTRVRRRSTAIQEGIEYYGGAWRSPKLIFHDHKGVLLIRQDTDSCPSGVPPQTPPKGSALRGESAPAFSGNPSGKPPFHQGRILLPNCPIPTCPPLYARGRGIRIFLWRSARHHHKLPPQTPQRAGSTARRRSRRSADSLPC